MRDKKDKATFDLPGFEPVTHEEAAGLPHELVARLVSDTPKSVVPRQRRAALKAEQLPLIEETDTSGLPVWRRDPALDLTGLPIWQPES